MFICKEIIQSKIIEFSVASGEEFKFKVEISQVDEKTFHFDLYKTELYRFRPTFTKIATIADEIVWIDYSHILLDDSPCSSPEECLEKVFQTFHYRFGLEIPFTQ